MNKQFKDFELRLKKWIDNNNIKQKDIAEKANVSKGYISAVVNGIRTPSEALLNTLSEMSGHSVHWWMFGQEDYDNLNSLNTLINTLIDIGEIQSDGSMRKEIRNIINEMVDKEIRVKLENKKAQG